jgi:nicotinic acetylcholine receptor
MNLRWNTTEYGNVKDLRIPPHRIWKPDVLMYNRWALSIILWSHLSFLFSKFPKTSSADEGFDGTYPTNVVVRNNGSCLYVPPGIFKSTCKIDITWFPFDDQRCEMKFGSWTYDGFQVPYFFRFGDQCPGIQIKISIDDHKTNYLNSIITAWPSTSRWDWRRY